MIIVALLQAIISQPFVALFAAALNYAAQSCPNFSVFSLHFRGGVSTKMNAPDYSFDAMLGAGDDKDSSTGDPQCNRGVHFCATLPVRSVYAQQMLSVEEEAEEILQRVHRFLSSGDIEQPRSFNYENNEAHSYTTIPNAMETDEESTFLIRCDAIRQYLGVDFDGSPMPLSLRQRLFFGSPRQHLEYKVKKARQAAKMILVNADLRESRSDDAHRSDIILLQSFILECVSPLKRYALKQYFFRFREKFNANLLLWLLAWFFVVSSLLFMLYWILAWGIVNGGQTMMIWGILFASSLVLDAVFVSTSSVIVMYYLSVEALYIQLRSIKAALSEVVQRMVQIKYGPIEGQANYHSDQLEVVQHMSGACRAAHSASLGSTASARILQHVNDIDANRCRYERLSYSGSLSHAVVAGTASILLVDAAVGETVVQQAIQAFWVAVIDFFCFLYDRSSLGFGIVLAILLLFLAYSASSYCRWGRNYYKRRFLHHRYALRFNRAERAGKAGVKASKSYLSSGQRPRMARRRRSLREIRKQAMPMRGKDEDEADDDIQRFESFREILLHWLWLPQSYSMAAKAFHGTFIERKKRNSVIDMQWRNINSPFSPTEAGHADQHDGRRHRRRLSYTAKLLRRRGRLADIMRLSTTVPDFILKSMIDTDWEHAWGIDHDHNMTSPLFHLDSCFSNQSIIAGSCNGPTRPSPPTAVPSAKDRRGLTPAPGAPRIISRAYRRASIEIIVSAKDLIDRVWSSTQVEDIRADQPDMDIDSSAVAYDIESKGNMTHADGIAEDSFSRRNIPNLHSYDPTVEVDAAHLHRVFSRAWSSLGANQDLYSQEDSEEMVEGLTQWLIDYTKRHETGTCTSAATGTKLEGFVKFGDFAEWFAQTYERMFAQKFYELYSEAKLQRGASIASMGLSSLDRESRHAVISSIGRVSTTDSSGSAAFLCYDKAYMRRGAAGFLSFDDDDSLDSHDWYFNLDTMYLEDPRGEDRQLLKSLKNVGLGPLPAPVVQTAGSIRLLSPSDAATLATFTHESIYVGSSDSADRWEDKGTVLRTKGDGYPIRSRVATRFAVLADGADNGLLSRSSRLTDAQSPAEADLFSSQIGSVPASQRLSDNLLSWYDEVNEDSIRHDDDDDEWRVNKDDVNTFCTDFTDVSLNAVRGEDEADNSGTLTRLYNL
jgi:hypothetical protein